jgi:DNA-binding CsgD family transcriptional regulator
MAKKPTYDELKQRIIALKKDVNKLKRTEEELRKSEERFRAQYKGIPVPTYTWQKVKNDFVLINCNHAAHHSTRRWSTSNIGEKASSILTDKPEDLKDMKKCYRLKKDIQTQWQYKDIETGKLSDFDVKIVYIPPDLVMVHSEDITKRKLDEKDLLEKEKKLELQAHNLKELNTALNVLLEHREKEKKTLEENIVSSIKRLVMPYLDELDKGIKSQKNKMYLNILKSNLDELLLPLTRKLSIEYMNLTPTEIKVADLIKRGQTSKEIALLLNVSPNAVLFHRKNIRRKLGLAYKKINLRTFLLSASKQ